MKPIPLEDNFTDVIAKAQRGLKIDNPALISHAKITREQLAAMQNGTVDDAVLRAIAPVLELDGEALVTLAHHAWHPKTTPPENGFAAFNTPFGDDMTVNSYLVWDPVVKEAAIFDTGTDATALLEFIQAKSLQVRGIFLTHTHPDHIAALDTLADATGATVYVPEREPITRAGAVTFTENDTFPLGYLTIKPLATWGHSPGLTTFLVSGLPQSIAIVGDALFSCSMGGSVDFYKEQRQNSAEKILTLPDDTLIAPGHGPLTTVECEKRHNPIFANR